jgi:hypothetical protein
MSDPVYTRHVDGAGNVSFVPVLERVAVSAPAVKQFVLDRSGEVSTFLGLMGGSAVSPVVANSVHAAWPLLVAGDFGGALLAGLPALLGVAGALAAVLTPEKDKGLSEAQISSAVGALGREQLVALLDRSVADIEPVRTAGEGGL